MFLSSVLQTKLRTFRQVLYQWTTYTPSPRCVLHSLCAASRLGDYPNFTLFFTHPCVSLPGKILLVVFRAGEDAKPSARTPIMYFITCILGLGVTFV
jgi:hypothetical protein